MAVPPVLMFIIAAAAVSVVVSVGIIAYNEYQDSQRRRTKALSAPRRSPRAPRREPVRPCKVCIDENATIQFLPCRHILLCRSCFREFNKEGEERCPDINCRTVIEDFIFIRDLE